MKAIGKTCVEEGDLLLTYKDFLFIPSRTTSSQQIVVYTDDIISTPERKELHYHDCFSIIYIIEPHVVFCMENQEEIIPQAGEFVFLLPRTVHALRTDNPKGYHIDIYIRENFFYQNILPHLADNPRFMGFFQPIYFRMRHSLIK